MAVVEQKRLEVGTAIESGKSFIEKDYELFHELVRDTKKGYAVKAIRGRRRTQG